MIKTEIPLHNIAHSWTDNVEDIVSTELTQLFGKDKILRLDNQYSRRQWSVTCDYFKKKVTVMCRYPEQAVIIRLKWL